MSEEIITTRGLDHAYGKHIALEDLDLAVPSGTTGLVGANGAGKTTLLKILIGMLHPAEGEAEVFGADPQRDPLGVRSRVGYMPELACLPPDQTAADFVSYAAELGGIPTTVARQRASEVLTLVGLAEERFRYIGEFSTGMQQRTKLAQAIVHDPDLVLLDEPTAGLDPDGRTEILDLIRRLHGFGMSVVLSSHVLGDVEQTCDWVVMLDGGHLLRSGPLDELSQEGAADIVYVEVFEAPETAADSLRGHGATVEIEGMTLAVTMHNGDPYLAIRDALADTPSGMRSLGTRARTLEDVYLEEEEAADE